MSMRAKRRGLSSLVLLTSLIGLSANTFAGSSIVINTAKPDLETNRKSGNQSSETTAADQAAAAEAAKQSALNNSQQERTQVPVVTGPDLLTVDSILQAVGVDRTQCAITSHNMTVNEAALAEAYRVEVIRAFQASDIAIDGEYTAQDAEALQKIMEESVANLSTDAQQGFLVLSKAIAEKAKAVGYQVPEAEAAKLTAAYGLTTHEQVLESYIWNQVTTELLLEAGWTGDKIEEFQRSCQKPFFL